MERWPARIRRGGSVAGCECWSTAPSPSCIPHARGSSADRADASGCALLCKNRTLHDRALPQPSVHRFPCLPRPRLRSRSRAYFSFHAHTATAGKRDAPLNHSFNQSTVSSNTVNAFVASLTAAKSTAPESPGWIAMPNAAPVAESIEN